MMSCLHVCTCMRGLAGGVFKAEEGDEELWDSRAEAKRAHAERMVTQR